MSLRGPSFLDFCEAWPSLGERRRGFVLRIVTALAVADVTVAAACARYCEHRVAVRKADRADRILRNRAQQHAARQTIRRSLRAKGGA